MSRRKILCVLVLSLTLVTTTSDMASAATVVKSTFGATNEGWWAAPKTNTPIPGTWDDGRVRVTFGDPYQGLIWLSPEKFERSWIDAYKGMLSFAMQWDATDLVPRAANVSVRISGGEPSHSITHVFPDDVLVTAEPQQAFRVRIRPGDWTVDNTDDTATGALMRYVLRDVRSFSLHVDGGTRPTDVFWLDGVKVKAPA
jgi:hypothetical protein